MSIGQDGQNLIFVVSQPRAGSTLLQRMLGSHPRIHTVSEPWLMLHPFYGLRRSGYEAEYGALSAQESLRGFLDQIGSQKQGDEVYYEGVRRMYSHLYDRALEGTGKQYFLDKTPRYYLILPELARVFPKAQFIILLRNPMAVLASVVNTWKKENWFSLFQNGDDLVRAPGLLLEGIKTLGSRGVVVRYEQLISRPDEELNSICSKLGITYHPTMKEYGNHRLPRWELGDQKGVYRHAQPVAGNAEKWQQSLSDPQLWRLAGDYLEQLGRDVVGRLGYSYDQIQKTVESYRPSRLRSWSTYSLSWLLAKPMDQRTRLASLLLRLKRVIQRQGVGGVAGVMKKTLSVGRAEGGKKTDCRIAGTNTKSPRITIITPSYNQGQYLEQTIRSVLDQGYGNLEYFVIDGGSNDDSVDIIRRYESRLAGWVSQPDKGQTDAISKGLARATGDIVAFLNSDDCYLPGTLDAVAGHMSGPHAVDWLIGCCDRVSAEGEPLDSFIPRLPVSFVQYLMGCSGSLPQPSCFWSSRMFSRYGAFDSEMHYSFDYEHHCRLMAGGEVPTLTDQSLAVFRVHPASKGVAERNQFLPERLRVARRYAQVLPWVDWVKLYRNIGYRARLHAIGLAEGGEVALWRQVAKHPWWLGSGDVRGALFQGAQSHKRAA